MENKNRLRELRLRLGLSQLQLSFLARVPNVVISDIELGKRKPWPKCKRLLAQALRCPVNEIFPPDDGNGGKGA